MSRIVLSIVAAAAIVGTVGTAHAAKPVSQACVGDSVSGGTQIVHPYGRAISQFAHETDETNRRGVGDDVQFLQNGEVPDSVFPNTCND